MKTVIMVVMLVAAITTCAWAADADAGRYKLVSVKTTNNDLAILLDTSTGRSWQVFVDSLGKITRLVAITAEGLVYAPKDEEQLYAQAKSANIEGLSTSDSATKAELDRFYGYGLDVNELVAIREKIKSSTLGKR